MAEYNINKIKLPNGDIVKLVDETSGYAKSSEVPTVVDTYSSTGTDAVSGKAVNAALQTLDSSITATTGQAISAITITDGKISGSNKISVGDANQNAFSNVKVGSSTISADTTTDTIELVAGTDITLTPDTTNDKVTIAFNNNSGYTTNTGTVTSVGLQNATNGGLSVSGSPVTGSGTISVGHSNILTNAQTTQALYPIAIDKNGHISSYGSAVDPEDIFLFEVIGSDVASSTSTYTVTATPNQLSSAINSGKVPVIKFSYANSTGESYYYLSEISPSGSGIYYYFSSPFDSGNGIIELYTTSSTASSFSDVSVGLVSFALSDHTHGNITSDGKISSTAVTPGNGDYILISDSSGSNEIERGIAIGTGTTKYLREDGTWQTVTSGVSDVKINNTSIVSSGVANIVTNTAYNSSTNKIATMNDIPSQTPTLCWYGTCSTTASTSEKAVTCSGYTLNAGNIIGVLFTTGSTAAIPSLNVNSTGAKTIYVGYSTTNSTTNTFTWSAGTMIYFMYDGSRYRYITSISDGFTSQAFGANTWYGFCSTGATSADKVVTCDNYVLTKGSLISIYFTHGNTYSGGVLQLNINLTGLYNIYYKSTRTSSSNTLFWDDGDTITFMYDGNYYRFISRSTNTSALTIRTWS